MKENKQVLKIEHCFKENRDGGVIGYVKSLNNIVRTKAIYKELNIENTKKKHVFYEPIIKIIEDKNNIKNMIKKIDFNKLALSNEKCLEFSDYYSIYFTNGERISIYSKNLSKADKQLLDALIENNEYSGNSSQKYIEKPPFLNYTNSNMKDKIDNLEQVKYYIENKQNKNFYNLLSDACKLNINNINKTVLGKNEITKFFKKTFGVLNNKLFGYVSADYEGFINKIGESDILLEVSFLFRKQSASERNNFLCDFKFENNMITTINVFKKDDLITKRLNQRAIDYILENKYNDWDEAIVVDSLANNKNYEETIQSMFGSRGTITNMNSINKN